MTPGFVKLLGSPGRAGGLPFVNYSILNKKNRVILTDFSTSITNFQSCPSLELQSLFIQLYRNSILVYPLQESGAQRIVYRISTPDYPVAEICVRKTHLNVLSIL